MEVNMKIVAPKPLEVPYFTAFCGGEFRIYTLVSTSLHA